MRSDRQRDFGAIGIGGGQKVFTVAFQDLAAVVSDTPIVIYDPTRENVLAHEFVNETVMQRVHRHPDVFGTVFRSEDDVTELLRSTYQAFSDVLDKMQDKIEFGLKVLWDREKVIANLERENDEIRRLKDEISRHTTTSTYFARMQLGRLVESALEDMSARYVADIHEALKPVAVASRSNKPIGDRMILNAAFLVDRAQEQAFDERVKETSRKYEEVLSVQVFGPVAAVQLREHQAEAGERRTRRSDGSRPLRHPPHMGLLSKAPLLPVTGPVAGIKWSLGKVQKRRGGGAHRRCAGQAGAHGAADAARARRHR